MPHPDQHGVGDGDVRFVMSARAIGEGRVSSVEFRTGVVERGGGIRVDAPSRYAACGTLQPATYDRGLLEAALDRPDDDDEALAFLLGRLPERFAERDVATAVGGLPPQLRVLRGTVRTVAGVRWFMACRYRRTFAGGDLSEHVLWPASPIEQQGIEDARFGTDYRAAYTAAGPTDRVQLLRTTDFHLRLLAAPRPGRRRQGSVTVPATGRRPVRGDVPLRPGAQRGGVLRRRRGPERGRPARRPGPARPGRGG